MTQSRSVKTVSMKNPNSWFKPIFTAALLLQVAVLSACGAGSGSAASSTPDVTIDQASTGTIAVHSGSTSSYKASTGIVYSADTGYTAGGTAASVTTAIQNTPDQPLYKDNRYGNYSYVFSVANGKYNVTLKFAETYWSSAGKRIFNVAINGSTVLSNFDIFAAAGGENIALDKTFPVTVTGGSITIALSSVTNYAQINALLIQPVASPSPSPSPSASPSPSPSPSPSHSASPSPSPSPSPSQTVTQSPSPTPSPSPSQTVTQSPSPSPSPSHSASPSPSPSPSPTQTPTPSPSPSTTNSPIVATNCGGSAYTASNGVVYAADNGYSGGWAATPTTPTVAGTTDQALYQTNRVGLTSYTYTVPNGNYNVVLKFAETYWTAAGDRLFDVAINGSTVLSNFDIFAAAGGENIAIDKTFPVSVTGGQIAIDFTTITDSPQVNALEIIPVTATPSPSPSASPSPTASLPTIAINCGGNSDVSSSGVVYSADMDDSGGWAATPTTAPVSGTSDQALYQTNRVGNFSYSIPVPNGNYNVVFGFC